MARCVQCGVETELHIRGVPICPACDRKHHQSMAAGDEEFQRLDTELTQSREAHRKARMTMSQACELASTLDPLNPDGTVVIEKARAALDKAWERYQEALNAYGKYRPRR